MILRKFAKNNNLKCFIRKCFAQKKDVLVVRTSVSTLYQHLVNYVLTIVFKHFFNTHIHTHIKTHTHVCTYVNKMQNLRVGFPCVGTGSQCNHRMYCKDQGI